MRYEADRESTFNARWPRDRVLATPKQIAKAGFYFLGKAFSKNLFESEVCMRAEGREFDAQSQPQ